MNSTSTRPTLSDQNITVEQIRDDEEEVVVETIRFFAVGVMCCLVFGGLVGVFGN